MDFAGVVTEICRETSYKLNDFYNKSFLQGGITLSQANALFDEIQKIKSKELETQAALQGIDLDKDSGKKKQEDLVFGNPEDYKDLSEEQKQELTDKMMNKFKNLGKVPGLG